MKKILAFSLIELMVVIAIVAILAAVAVPAYKNYLIGTRLAAAGMALQEVAQRSIEFSATHGRFANAVELGLNVTAPVNSEWNADDAIAINVMPYYLPRTQLGYWQTQDSSAQVGLASHCGAVGYTGLMLDAQALGFSPDVVDDNTCGVWMECDFWNYENVVRKFCWYNYCNSSAVYGTADLLPGWTNYPGAYIGSFGNISVSGPANLMAMPGYTNPECQ